MFSDAAYFNFCSCTLVLLSFAAIYAWPCVKARLIRRKKSSFNYSFPAMEENFRWLPYCGIRVCTDELWMSWCAADMICPYGADLPSASPRLCMGGFHSHPSAPKTSGCAVPFLPPTLTPLFFPGPGKSLKYMTGGSLGTGGKVSNRSLQQQHNFRSLQGAVLYLTWGFSSPGLSREVLGGFLCLRREFVLGSPCVTSSADGDLH